MYKIVKMKFKSIIKNYDETSSVEFEGNGTIRSEGDILAYYLDHANDHYELIIDGNKLTLKQNRSTLHFIKGKKIENDYKIAYGTLLLQGYLERMDVTTNGLKIVYDLYESNEKVARVYMQLIII